MTVVENLKYQNPISANKMAGYSGGRHQPHYPRHLKGKEIGLYFARKGKKNKIERDNKKRLTVAMDGQKEGAITNLLEDIKDKEYKELQSPENINETCNMHSSGLQFATEYHCHLQDTFKREIGCNPKYVSSDCGLKRNVDLDKHLELQFNERLSNSKYQNMMQFRTKLPSCKMQKKIVDVIENNQVVVISGETGCGKTTQVPQFILDHYIRCRKGSLCRIICTQPRRISAITVAERVAEERAVPCGQQSDVGYQIRLECKLPRDQGSILFCTTGIILQRLQNDPFLSNTSHIIMDEVHERDLQSDFLLIILRDLLQERSDLKIILMSATLNAEMFSKYFGHCPMIEIPGFTFPVKEFLLEDIIEETGYTPGNKGKRKYINMPVWKKYTKEGRHKIEKLQQANVLTETFVRNLDYRYSEKTKNILRNWNEDKIDLDLVACLIKHICLIQKEGAILVFLPGWEEISKLNTILTNDYTFANSRYRIFPLHSLMPTVNQKEVFNRPPPGIRKIIIATNIAETSITIDDVVYVVDCGKIKMKTFDIENNIPSLNPEWVAISNAKQRKGRAGRVQPGICYHLYTKCREMQLANQQLPEILRTRLEELCLKVKILKLGKVEQFVSKAMEPPDLDTVKLSLKLLRSLNALDGNENLTPLGYHLARLPLDPHTGKMILLGAIFSCLDPILTVAANLSFKDAFVIPLGKEKLVDRRKRELAGDSHSDHIMVVAALEGWEEAKERKEEYAFCREYFLSGSKLKMLANLKKQFAQYLHQLYFLHCDDPKHPDFNKNSDNTLLLKAIICAGLYPNVAQIIDKKKKRNAKFNSTLKVRTKDARRVSLHPKSVNAFETEFDSEWLVYHQKIKSSEIFLHDTTMVNPYPLLFFGGHLRSSRERKYDVVSVDEWIVFHCPQRTAKLVMDLRAELDDFLKYRIYNPGVTNWSTSEKEGCLLKAIVELITSEETLSVAEFERNCRNDEDF